MTDDTKTDDTKPFVSTQPTQGKCDEVRDDLLVPLSRNDLVVLAWFAEWKPELHHLDWKRRRQWPPGFRAIDDVSI